MKNNIHKNHMISQVNPSQPIKFGMRNNVKRMVFVFAFLVSMVSIKVSRAQNITKLEINKIYVQGVKGAYYKYMIQARFKYLGKAWSPWEILTCKKIYNINQKAGWENFSYTEVKNQFATNVEVRVIAYTLSEAYVPCDPKVLDMNPISKTVLQSTVVSLGSTPTHTTSETYYAPSVKNDIFGKVSFKVYYELPLPKLSSSNTSFCINESSPIKLRTSLNWPNHKGVKYEWYGCINGNCKTFISLDTNLISTENNKALENFLSVKKEESGTFKIRYEAGNFKSDFGSTVAFSVSPAAPTFQTSINQPECVGKSGKISLNDIKGSVNSYQYVIYKGHLTEDKLEADSIVTSGDANNGNIDIDDTLSFVAGKYTVELRNYKNGYGSCRNLKYVTITDPVFLPLNLIQEKLVTKNISCEGKNDGSIKIAAEGGTGDYIFELYNKNTQELINTINKVTEAEFSNLYAGTYLLKVIDTCADAEDNMEITLTQPTQVTGNLAVAQPGCIQEVDGSFEVNVQNGSGNYTYTLLKDGNLFAELANTQETSWTLEQLTPATYSLTVLDANLPNCPGYEVDFDIVLPEPLSLEAQPLPITCNGDTDGKVTLIASGGSQNYVFTITHQQEKIEQTNQTGIFENLIPGMYTALLKNNNDFCSDEVIIEFEIGDVTPLETSIDFHKITCLDAQDGWISAQPVGGNGGYQYTWFLQQDGNSWFNLNLSDSLITDLFAGVYKVYIEDQKGCSLEKIIEITEPATPLTLHDPQTEFVICQGSNSVKLNIFASGGWGDYSYEYQLQGQDLWQAFPEENLFEPGTYYVRVVDEGGCIIAHESPVVVDEVSDASFEVNFLVPTEMTIGDTAVLKEVSWPKPTKVVWDFGENVNVIDNDPHSPAITFAEPGEYVITLSAELGTCSGSRTKTLVFSLPNGKEAQEELPAQLGKTGIYGVDVYPNPNEGRFHVSISLDMKRDVSLKMFNLFGEELFDELLQGSDEYERDIIVQVEAGLYLLKINDGINQHVVRLMIK